MSPVAATQKTRAPSRSVVGSRGPRVAGLFIGVAVIVVVSVVVGLPRLRSVVSEGPCESINVGLSDRAVPADSQPIDANRIVLRVDSSNMQGAYVPVVIADDGTAIGPTDQIGAFRRTVLSRRTLADLQACLADSSFQSSPSYASQDGHTEGGALCGTADLSLMTYTARSTAGGIKAVSARAEISGLSSPFACLLDQPAWIVAFARSVGQISDLIASTGLPAQPPPADLLPE